MRVEEEEVEEERESEWVTRSTPRKLQGKGKRCQCCCSDAGEGNRRR